MAFSSRWRQRSRTRSSRVCQGARCPGASRTRGRGCDRSRGRSARLSAARRALSSRKASRPASSATMSPTRSGRCRWSGSTFATAGSASRRGEARPGGGERRPAGDEDALARRPRTARRAGTRCASCRTTTARSRRHMWWSCTHCWKHAVRLQPRARELVELVAVEARGAREPDAGELDADEVVAAGRRPARSLRPSAWSSVTRGSSSAPRLGPA